MYAQIITEFVRSSCVSPPHPALGIVTPAQQYQSKHGLRRYGAISGRVESPAGALRSGSGVAAETLEKNNEKNRRISQIFLAFVEKCGIIKL